MTVTNRASSPGRTDDSTVIRMSQADPERFGEIFDAHFAEIHRYVVRRIGRDAAEDVVAETFLAAFRKRASYDADRASVRTWLYGIATNLVSRHRRSEVRRLRALGRHGGRSPDLESHEERVATVVSAEGLRPELAKAIARLSPGIRDALLLSALAGLSNEEIAAALDVSYGTVGSRLNRARKKLREALGGTNPMLDLEDNHE